VNGPEVVVDESRFQAGHLASGCIVMGRDPGAASTWCVAHAFRYGQVDVNAARNTIDGVSQISLVARNAQRPPEKQHQPAS
jgi:hypothetical protein